VDQVYKISAWIPLFLGLVALIIGIIDFNAMKVAVGNFQGSVGSGLYVATISSFGIFFGAFLDLVRSRKNSHRV